MRGASARLPHRQLIPRILWIGHRIFRAANGAENEMAERNLIHAGRGHHITAQQALDAPAVFARDRRIQLERIVPGCVPLPADGRDRVAVAQQPGIPCVACEIPIAPIGERDDPAMATIGYFQHDGAIALSGVPGFDRNEISREADFAAGQVGRLPQVDDRFVMWIADCHRKEHLADQALVGSGSAVALSAKHIASGGYLDADDSRVGLRCSEDCEALTADKGAA